MTLPKVTAKNDPPEPTRLKTVGSPADSHNTGRAYVVRHPKTPDERRSNANADVNERYYT
jgi:hypothetical protein